MKRYGVLFCGIAAGIINGLLGAGGGMILIPLLCLWTDLEKEERFPCSVAMMLPMCGVSALISSFHGSVPWSLALPYMSGGILGGFLAGKFGARIPLSWMHKILGILILWGGIRYLW